MQINNLTSSLIPSQLPEYIRDNPDYANFVTFIQAYYEWMEQQGGALYGSKNLLEYQDIDKTSAEFLDFFKNDFLQYFPEDVLVDSQKAIKLARQLYESKGTPASYQFLFRILYDIDFDVFYTKDAVLRASDGQWYVPKSLKLSSLSTSASNFLNINNYTIFGETTKSKAVIETSVLSGNKVEVFISNIERLFQSGETIQILDSNNQPVLVDGQVLSAKIVGQVSQVRIDPNRRGLLYQAGDPVIVFGGLSSETGRGALAEVGSTTSGAIQTINVIEGGYGYRENPNTLISITNAPGSSAVVGSLDPNPATTANVTLAPIDTISLKRFITIGNTNYNFSAIAVSNANTTLANAFSFSSFLAYPITSVLLTNGGGGINRIPEVGAQSVFTNDISEPAYLSSLGILAPVQISNGGNGYEVNDTIVLTGGSGYGAYANVTGVSANGEILNVAYVSVDSQSYPLGGLGYRNDGLPTVSVASANVLASNASLFVPGILGAGAEFSVVVDRVGSITTINLLDGGEDYIETPNVSIKVQDIVVSNVTIGNLPQKGDIVFQGANTNVASYQATVNSISLLATNEEPTASLYRFRVFNYSNRPNTNLTLKIEGKDIELSMANAAYDSTFDSNGIRTYGDGNARGTASFLNGLVIGQGEYLSSRGQPSSFSIIQNEIYNNFTYQITVEKEISKYREILLNLLHPSGMKMLGRYAMKANAQHFFHTYDALYTGQPLSYYTGYNLSNIEMVADFDNKSNNIITFNNLLGANIATFLIVGDSIEAITQNGPSIKSEIISIDWSSNTAVLSDNTWLTYANVASVQANSGSNVINILSLTGSYDIINNRQYSNTQYPIKDIVYAGDLIKIANNSPLTVEFVDFLNDRLIISGTVANNSNSLLSVNRTFDTTNVIIYGPVGFAYTPIIITQDGNILLTQDGKNILIQ